MTVNQDRIKAIEERGAKVTFGYRYVGEPGVDRHEETLYDEIRGVHLPFTAVEWSAMAMRDGGAYVGGCCGNMSALQDIVNMVFRDSGYVESGDLLTAAFYAQNHDGFEEFEPMDDAQFAEAIENWKRVDNSSLLEGTIADPWFKFGVIYNAVEPGLEPRSYETPKPPPERKRTVQMLERTLAYLDWGDLFHDADRDDNGQHEADRLLNRAKAYPLAKELVAELESTEETFDGYALVEPGTDRLLQNGLGACLFRDRAGAERTVEVWQRLAKDDEDEAPRYEIVRVTVTIPGGLEVKR